MHSAALPQPSPGITELGHDVYEIDTRMAGYPGITAGYLIRGSRPCLVETGTAPSAPVVREALTALGVGPADLAPDADPELTAKIQTVSGTASSVAGIMHWLDRENHAS